MAEIGNAKVGPSAANGPARAAPRREAPQQAQNALQWPIRAGFCARGFTYGVIGTVALALALGAGHVGTAANQQGALAILAEGWLGRLALIAIAVSLLAYALWKLWLGVHGDGPEGGGGRGWSDRVANLAGGLVYVGFCAVAVRVLVEGGSRGSSSEPRRTAAGILGWPGGQWIVGIAGAVLIVISVYQLYDAVMGRFAQDSKVERMGPTERRTFLLVGRIGIGARAFVFGLVGYFVLRAAIEFDSRSAVGLDGVLARVHRQPFGPWLLGFVAAGLLVFAAFSFVEGHYRRL